MSEITFNRLPSAVPKAIGSVLLVIFIAEILVMWLLHTIQVDSVLNEILLDGLLLTVVSSPLIYYLVAHKIIYKNEQLIFELSSLKSDFDTTALISKTDTDGVITYVNKRFCDISQYSTAELVGKSHTIVNSGIHSKEFWHNCWQTIISGQVWKGEVCNKAKDGTYYWVESTFLPTFNTKQEIIGYSAIRVDITDRKRVEEQLTHNSTLAILGEIAAGVGHEINNPLVVADGTLAQVEKQLIAEGVKTPILFEKIKKISETNKRIRNIVDGLRTFATSDTSSDQEHFSMEEAVKRTINLIAAAYEREGVLLTVEKSTVELFIFGHIGLLQQILINLISNARDATKGQKVREVRIVIKGSGDQKGQLLVSDNGTGIPQLLQKKIFEPFFTTKGGEMGTGIGLTLVDKLVTELGGELSLDSQIGEGTTFTATFPVVVKSEDDCQSLEVKSVQPRSGSVLVIDDEEDIREILAEMIEDMGMTVEQADDGDTALEMVKLKRYDYICTDIRMPRMSGDRFIEEARKLPNGETTIIIISGGIATNYSPADRSAIIKLGDVYVTKPFGQESIEDAFNKVSKK
ncbi:MAG: response regulator [Bdellovibrionales bacterium]|jgi:PAS domain S-box-containing protein|nr:response regulator [Bdellovibrionales bacterium]MBT3525657.1 response regulator [Bdellovibrionales bacterium]MBT7670261.1 response regulator [Bdellovibrionales bacterium]MBT7766066.1 response regulator [Bdellovibrionales bacterium]